MVLFMCGGAGAQGHTYGSKNSHAVGAGGLGGGLIIIKSKSINRNWNFN